MSIPTPTTSTEITVTSNTSGNKTVASVAVGDLLVVQVCDVGEASVTFSASDDKGNTWATAASQAGSDAGNSAYILWAVASTAGSTVVTVTASGTTDFVAKVHLIAASGGTFTRDAYSNIYKSSAIGASYPCSATSADIDTTGEAIVFTAGVTDGPGDGGFGTLTVGSGYTEVTCSTSVAFWQYQIFSTAVSNERGTFTSSAGKKAATCIAAFKLDSLPSGGDEGTGDGTCGHKRLVQEVSIYEAAATSSSETLTLAAGNLIVVCVNTLDDTDVDITVEDDQSGTWRDVVTVQASGSANKASIWACLSAPGGSTEITVAVSSSCEFAAHIYEWNSEAGTWYVGGYKGLRSTSVNVHSCGTLSVTVPAVFIGNSTVDTSTSQTFGEVYGYDGSDPTLYYSTIAPTAQVAWIRRIASEGLGSHAPTFYATTARAAASVSAAFRTVCESGGCWWPCCSGGGGSVTPEACTVRKIDEDGNEVWRYNATTPLQVTVDRTNDKVYVAGDFTGDYVGRFDSAAGTLDLSFGTSITGPGFKVVPADNAMYAGYSAFELDGTPIYSASSYATEPLAAAPGYLYSSQINIQRVDPSDGSLIWLVTGPTNGTPCQAVAASGDLWAAESDTIGNPVTIYKYLAADGSLDDSFDLTTIGAGASGMALDGSDNIFLTSNNGTDSATYSVGKFSNSGSEQWETPYPGIYSAIDQLPVCVNLSTGDVFVGSGTEVIKFNSSGVWQWSFDHTATIYSIDCDDDGNVYIAGEEAAD